MGMTSDAKAILWMDLETTGSNEVEDAIIEVGAILTDFELTAISSKQAVCKPTDHAYERMMNNDVVRAMHTVNGLIKELDEGRALDLHDVDNEFAEWVRLHVPSKGRRVILAGSGVSHFDRRFIDAQLYTTASFLVYPSLDVGVLRRFFRYCGTEFNMDAHPKKNHRAFDDIYLHLNEARQFRDFIRRAQRVND